jgi:hypothetical protein
VLEGLDEKAEIASEDVTSFLRACVSERIMVCEDDRYLSLALPRNRHW